MNKKKEIIILVHGFARGYRDMLPLSNNLVNLGYETHAVNLPTTFKSIEACYLAFKEQFLALELTSYEQIHLVGHSMGGLVIRYYLSKERVQDLGRCVLIGTPNKGSKLADIGNKIPFGALLVKPIAILKSEADDILPPLNIPTPEFGVIAGRNHRLPLTGALLEKPNDGRVEVASTKMDESLMKAFIVLDFVHTKIHDKVLTASLVDEFLQKGCFEC